MGLPDREVDYHLVMALFRKNKHWEDEYDEYYAQDRGVFDPDKKTYTNFRIIPHALLLLAIGAIFLGAVSAVAGPTMAEKMLTDLAMPTGLIWLTLMVMIYFCLLNRQKWPAMAGMFCWLILTLAGNSFIANLLIANLESSFQDVDVFKVEPLETAVVLGGGTSSRVTGGSQLNAGGDRVAIAARLYHAGKVNQFICTGTSSFRTSKLDLSPREEAAEILIGLGVPSERVVQMEGRNTSEEMKQLGAWLKQNPDHGRIGIITSAWHMPRVMRLANANGVDAVALPADYQTSSIGPSPNLIVPSSINLEISRRALKEYLATLVGR